MFGSNILDTAIGLILVFLLMSLICSALREILESVLKQRAVDLEHGLRELLQDPVGDALVKDLYSHPMINGLFSGEYEAKRHTLIARWFGLGRKLPSYIPKANFARAIIDLYQQGKVQSPAVQAALRSLSQDTGNDIVALRTNIEGWFDSSVERIGGWYKRRTQAILLALGLIMAFALNVNTIKIANALYKQSALRAAVVATAQTVTQQVQPAAGTPQQQVENSIGTLNTLANSGLPMGWSGRDWKYWAGWRAWLGWFLTAVAVTLGAPFWFDMLNKVVSLRSTIKPREPAPAPAPDTSTDGSAPARPFTVAVRTRDVGDGDVVTAGVTVTSSSADEFIPHEWSDPNHEEGVL